MSTQKREILLITQAMDQDHPILGFFVSWVRTLAAYGDPITVVCWHHGRCENLPSSVTILAFPKGKWRRTWGLFKLSWQKRHAIGAVFVHMITPVTAALGWWWRLLGFRIVQWYMHGHVPLSLRITNVFAHRILTATPESMRLDTPKKHVTGHGIDTNIYKPDSSIKRESMMLYVGRITPRKNLQELILACASIRTSPEMAPFSLVLVGEPYMESDHAYAQELSDLIRTHGMESYVRWAGTQTGTALLKLYSQTALFVNPSKTGSLDKTVLEAMACEAPVLATGEVYAHLTNVRYIPSLLAPEALAYMRECLDSPTSLPSARREVQEKAELSRLIARIHSELLPQ